MNDKILAGGKGSRTDHPGRRSASGAAGAAGAANNLGRPIDALIDVIAPCPWTAHAGANRPLRPFASLAARPPLYSAEERARRDASPWTIVQGILAPLQFLAFAVSLGFIARYLITGQGYEIATASILIKTIALYAIMVTGSIWEKEVFGQWLFARAFFWEDVFSMLVLSLQTLYLFALVFSWGSPRQQMMIAIAAYGAYVVNASQFLIKLRAARLEAPLSAIGPGGRMGQAA